MKCVKRLSSDWVLGILAISLILSSSTAFADRADVELFVTRFYQQCLGRNPDSEGLNTWVNSVVNGYAGGADVAYGFLFSEEYLNMNTTNEEFLIILYRVLFNREPDPTGYFSWLNRLYNLQMQGQSDARAEVLEGFIHSREFINLCSVYGINPYSTVDAPTPPETPSDGDIALESLVGTYALVSFSTTYNDGSVVTSNDVTAFSGGLTIEAEGSVLKIIEIDGAVEITTGIILEAGTNYLRISIIGCTHNLTIDFSNNILTTISPMGTCDNSYQQIEVWEKNSTT